MSRGYHHHSSRGGFHNSSGFSRKRPYPDEGRERRRDGYRSAPTRKPLVHQQESITISKSTWRSAVDLLGADSRAREFCSRLWRHLVDKSEKPQKSQITTYVWSYADDGSDHPDKGINKGDEDHEIILHRTRSVPSEVGYGIVRHLVLLANDVNDFNRMVSKLHQMNVTIKGAVEFAYLGQFQSKDSDFLREKELSLFSAIQLDTPSLQEGLRRLAKIVRKLAPHARMAIPFPPPVPVNKESHAKVTSLSVGEMELPAGTSWSEQRGKQRSSKLHHQPPPSPRPRTCSSSSSNVAMSPEPRKKENHRNERERSKAPMGTPLTSHSQNRKDRSRAPSKGVKGMQPQPVNVRHAPQLPDCQQPEKRQRHSSSSSESEDSTSYRDTDGKRVRSSDSENDIVEDHSPKKPVEHRSRSRSRRSHSKKRSSHHRKSSDRKSTSRSESPARTQPPAGNNKEVEDEGGDRMPAVSDGGQFQNPKSKEENKPCKDKTEVTGEDPDSGTTYADTLAGLSALNSVAAPLTGEEEAQEAARVRAKQEAQQEAWKVKQKKKLAQEQEILRKNGGKAPKSKEGTTPLDTIMPKKA